MQGKVKTGSIYVIDEIKEKLNLRLGDVKIEVGDSRVVIQWKT